MSRKIRFLMIFKKVGGSHEDAECNGSEFGEPSSDSGWCLCRATCGGSFDGVAVVVVMDL